MNKPVRTDARNRGAKASLIWLAGPILVVVIAGALFRWPQTRESQHGPQSLLFQGQALDRGAGPKNSSGESEAKPNDQGLAGKDPQAGAPRPEFLAWFSEEAKGVSDLKVDEVQREQRIQQQIRSFTANDWSELARRFGDQGQQMNDRLLSGLLLGRGAFDHLDLVDEIMEKPLPTGNPAPHSIEESEMMREKSLRLMVIEEMIQAVKKDRSRLSSLQQAVRKIEDSHLRALAERRMREEGL